MAAELLLMALDMFNSMRQLPLEARMDAFRHHMIHTREYERERMELARYDNIIAIKTDEGKVVGFHAHNLQVAHLDEAVWEALRSPETSLPEVQDEIAIWNREQDDKATDSHIPQAIRSLTINVSQICNLHCSYCAAGGDGSYGAPIKEIELQKLYDQIRMLLHDVPAGDSFTFTFLGGEPLLAPHAIRSIARFIKLQVAGRGIAVRYGIVTNGTLITPENAELLASIGCHVTISIDGPAEVNDRSRPTRGGQGSTLRTLQGLENLKRVHSRLGSLNAAATFGTHYTGVLATYRFLRSFDFDKIKIEFAASSDDREASRAYAQEVAKTAEEAWSFGGENELRKFNVFDYLFRTLDKQKRIHNFCGAGKDHLQVDAQGRFYVCQWFVNDKTEEVGDGTTLDHEKLKAYADPLTELNKCGNCWARHLCGGGCMFVHRLKTGSKHQTDNEFCVRTRSIIAKGIEYYAQARVQGGEGDRSEVH